jgi:hypothetical protein
MKVGHDLFVVNIRFLMGGGHDYTFVGACIVCSYRLLANTTRKRFTDIN